MMLRILAVVLLFVVLSGCAGRQIKPFGEHLGAPVLIAGLYLTHEYQPWTDEALKTHGSKFKGQNPFLELDFGLEWRNGVKLFFETGTSITSGFPLDRSDRAETHWVKFKLGPEWGGY